MGFIKEKTIKEKPRQNAWVWLIIYNVAVTLISYFFRESLIS